MAWSARTAAGDAAIDQQAYTARDHCSLMLCGAELTSMFCSGGPNVNRTFLLAWLASWRSSVADPGRDYSSILQEAEVSPCEAFLGDCLTV